MKKLLSIAAVAALFSTGAMADNTITLEGTVQKAATVQLKSAFTGTDLTSATGLFNDYVMSMRKELPLGDETNMVTEPLFLQTNGAANTVTITLAYDNILSGTGATIPLHAYYKKDGGTEGGLASGTAISMTDSSGTNDGTAKVGDLKITGTAANNQEAGNYNGTITVTITPN